MCVCVCSCAAKRAHTQEDISTQCCSSEAKGCLVGVFPRHILVCLLCVKGHPAPNLRITCTQEVLHQLWFVSNDYTTTTQQISDLQPVQEDILLNAAAHQTGFGSCSAEFNNASDCLLSLRY